MIAQDSFLTEILPPVESSFIRIASLLKSGEVIALPTETVYGLAGNATSTHAIEKIFNAKERPHFDPLIVHVASSFKKHEKGALTALVDQKILSPSLLSWPMRTLIERAMQELWPGPLTFVLPKGTSIPNSVTSNQDTVAIRMPAHPLFQEILSRVDFPLAAPSANRFGRISPTQAQHVLEELKGRIPAILDGGACEIGLESTIISVNPIGTATVLRPGKIGIHELGKYFNCTDGNASARVAVVAPGMLDQHYSPRKPLYLVPFSFHSPEGFDFLEKTIPQINHCKIGVIGSQNFPDSIELLLTKNKFSLIERRNLSSDGNLTVIAHQLFATLRELDQSPNVDAILVDLPRVAHTEGLYHSIKDRLNRASKNKPFS